MQRLLSTRKFNKRTVFLSRVIASTLSLNFIFTLNFFGEVTEDRLTKKKRRFLVTKTYRESITKCSLLFVLFHGLIRQSFC